MDDYERRLLAAAQIVISSDRRKRRTPPTPSEIGITAELKPYQIEGLSWLLSRFDLGVNVILGTTFADLFYSIIHLTFWLISIDWFCFGLTCLSFFMVIAGDEVSCC
jgi:hypothetical protein